MDWFIPITMTFFSATLLAGVFEKNHFSRVMKDLFLTSLLFLGSTLCFLYVKIVFYFSNIRGYLVREDLAVAVGIVGVFHLVLQYGY